MTAQDAARSLEFFRYDGAGNDFLLTEAGDAAASDWPATARRLCARGGGQTGADGLVLLFESSDAGADVRVEIINADGSIPEMCGNGARCVVVHWFACRPAPGDGAVWPAGSTIRLQTRAGLIEGTLLTPVPAATGGVRTLPGDTGAEYRVRLDMGEARTTWQAVGATGTQAQDAISAPLELGPARLTFYGASLGNPHVVTFVDDVAGIDVARSGALIERDAHFPRGTNVHFVQFAGRDHLRVRHWERGSGETLACGTGAVACAVIAIKRGLAASPVRVDVPGGELGVVWDGQRAWLEGPVRVHADEQKI